jgi:hypothetical protein
MNRQLDARKTPTPRAFAFAVAGVLVMLAAACGGDGASKPKTTPVPPATLTSPAGPVVLRGKLTLDGVPADSRFLGVRVVRDGLSAACQRTIPTVTAGSYEIGVLADTEMRGCGADGAQIVLWLWVEANDAFVYSTESVPWPRQGGPVAFDPKFSTTAPGGATRPVTGFKGHLFGRDGAPLPSGTVIEAYVGDVRCGLASLRAGDEIERFYTLAVSGPDSVPGCAKDAKLTFRLDGQPASQTAINDLGGDANGKELDLTVQ